MAEVFLDRPEEALVLRELDHVALRRLVEVVVALDLAQERRGAAAS
ncbi:MAG: hypothetical protein ACRDLM_00750 [Gaiellaceae bacterium]